MENEDGAMMNPIQIQDKEEDLGSEEAEPHFPLTVTSRVLHMLGDIAACKFTKWLELVRSRTHAMPSCAGESSEEIGIDSVSVCVWERLGKASVLDIESSAFSWDALASLHHSQHSATAEHSEDEFIKPLEVTVNSGGVVFFAFFGYGNEEAAAVIKFSSSRMATQSERLGYELAKWVGVRTPQARVIHNSSPEWLQIKKAAEKARDSAVSRGDQVGEFTCSQLLEALELSRCLFLMSYVHGSPLLESCKAFEARETAEKTAGDLGRVLLLDLVIRNEDRLPCRILRWRGNFANLLLADKTDEAVDSPMKRHRPRVTKSLSKERRASSVDSRFSSHNSSASVSQAPDLCDITESPKSSDMSSKSRLSDMSTFCESRIVAIDSGVPRRPPAGKRADDQATYPKLVELLLNSPDYAANLLADITGGKLGCLLSEDDESRPDIGGSSVQDFRNGFRAALRDMQGFHIFLLTLHQKLESLLRAFMNIIAKNSSPESDKEDLGVSEPWNCPSPPSKELFINENHLDLSDSEQRSAPRSGNKDSPDSSSPASRDNWHGKFGKGSSEHLRNLRLTAKLRDFHKFAKVDAELNKELEQWNETLKNEAVKLCQDNNFNTGFFEGSENNCVIDAYEMKVRLEHILERIVLISEAANTERPSKITSSLFIGGALAARSVYTLHNLGITHILCLCSNEIGQSDSQFPDLFEYRNFSINDKEDADISSIFEEASGFVESVDKSGGKVLVHCFEGRSRSATVVIAYLMLIKKMSLAEAWKSLKRVHRRAQPNDGFAKMLVDLDRKVHGKVSMEWQKRKPTMKVCPICTKNAGLSTSSLKLHLQKWHKKVSSGSVDSAMTVEIHKALLALNIARSQSQSQSQSQSDIDD